MTAVLDGRRWVTAKVERYATDWDVSVPHSI